MTARIVSACVLVPVVVVLVLLGGAPFFVGVTIMCLAAMWELTALLRAMAARDAGDQTWRYFTLAAGALILFGVFYGHYRAGSAQLAGAGVLVASLIGPLFAGPPAKRIVEWAAGVATVAYVAGLGIHFILLRDTSQGLAWTLLVCAVTWCTDIGAFFVGRRYGRRPFFKAISPKKTLEGAAGGLAAGTVAAVVVILAGGIHVPVPAGLLLGVAVSAVAQAGDLVESLVKREAGVKDSGKLIPGHGGVLDRIDSLLFAVTVTYYLRLLFT